MSKYIQSAIKEFEDLMINYDNLDSQKWADGVIDWLTSTLTNAIAEAKEEERSRIIEQVQVNQKGLFDDDNGNACWDLDDLVKSLSKETNG